MYTKHFGLKTIPFQNAPDSMFFYDDGEHALVRTRIRESFKAEGGLVVLTGPTGSGKTTLSHMIKSDFSDDTRLIWITEPPGNSVELFQFIAGELDLNTSLPITNTLQKALIIRNIASALSQINAEGRKCLLIIDEVHHAIDDILNSIRLLNNLEKNSTRLIRILLIAQEELIEAIYRPKMEHFKQLISTLGVLGRMNSDDIQKYISHRIQVAGGQPSLFSNTGWDALGIAFNSGGMPFVINQLCDRSLARAFENSKTAADGDDVYEAATGLGLDDNVLFRKYGFKQSEVEKQDPPAGEDRPVRTPAFVEEEEMNELKNKKGQSETSDSPENGSGDGYPANESGQKIVKKGRLRKFAHMILGRKDGRPAEEREPATSIEEIKTETTEEIDFLHMEKETTPSSEWVSIDSIKVTSFNPVNVKDSKPTANKGTAAKYDGWIRAGTKKFDIVADKEGKILRKVEKPSSSSEWVTIDSIKANSFNPRNIKDNKARLKNGPEVTSDEWVRAGTEKFDIIADKDGNNIHRIKTFRKQRIF